MQSYQNSAFRCAGDVSQSMSNTEFFLNHIKDLKWNISNKNSFLQNRWKQPILNGKPRNDSARQKESTRLSKTGITIIKKRAEATVS